MLTIFTPTYNRKYTLSAAYKALCCQTCQEFIWLIIDDGSSDGTESLVQQWIEEALISIQYYKQKNGGKMRAHNKGVELCNTELFVCIDSDDYLVPDAVETILTTWDSLDNRETLSGIVAYRGRDPLHTMFGEAFPDTTRSSLFELYQQGFFGETTLIYRTDLLRQYPFPVYDGESFIPEAVSYDQIDMHYQLALLPKVLTICEYQADGLSNSIDIICEKNPKGWLLYYCQRISFVKPSILRYKYLAHGIRFCWFLKEHPFSRLPASKAEILCAVPGALLLCLKRKL